MRVQATPILPVKPQVSFGGSFQFALAPEGDTFQRLQDATVSWAKDERQRPGVESVEVSLERVRTEARLRLDIDTIGEDVPLAWEPDPESAPTVTISTYTYKRRPPFAKHETTREYIGNPGAEQIPVEPDPTGDAALLTRLREILGDSIYIRYSPEPHVSRFNGFFVTDASGVERAIDEWRQKKAPKSWLQRLLG